jgi:epoxyqueuosine reductase
MLQEFSLELEKIDSLFGIIDINRIMEIQEEIALQKGSTSLETSPYCTDYYDFEMIKNQKSINSVFIVATPSPFYVLRTKYNEKNIDLKIPPIYGNRSDILENIKSVTAKIFTKYGLSTFPVILPKKLLAVYSGLAQYGNNGLAYIKGMGSYFRLTTFATDFRNNTYTWIKPSLMNSCAHCGKCIENCPTKALKHGTPWVNVNKCITEFNEQEGDFPDWLHRDWHNCVIGCIKCQEVCPLNNKEWRTIIIPIEYSEVEELLHSKYFSDLSEHLKTILKSLDLDRYYTEIKRNINYLIIS